MDLIDLTDEELSGVDARLTPEVREVLTIDGAVASVQRAVEPRACGLRSNAHVSMPQVPLTRSGHVRGYVDKH